MILAYNERNAATLVAPSRPSPHQIVGGDPGMAISDSTIRRFLLKVQKTDTCWLWAGLRNKRGYGRFYARELNRDDAIAAHRFAFHAFVRVLNPDECVMHTCDTPECVNPSHLRAGSYADNNQDMFLKRRAWQAGATHCPSGHAYDKANTTIRGARRYCRMCQALDSRRRRALVKAGEYQPHIKTIRRAIRNADGTVVEVFTPRCKADAERVVRVAAPNAGKHARKTILVADFLRDFTYGE